MHVIVLIVCSRVGYDVGNGLLFHFNYSISIYQFNNNKHQIASRQQTDFKNHNFRKNKIITDHDVRSYAYGDDNDYWGCTIVHKM